MDPFGDPDQDHNTNPAPSPSPAVQQQPQQQGQRQPFGSPFSNDVTKNDDGNDVGNYHQHQGLTPTRPVLVDAIDPITPSALAAAAGAAYTGPRSHRNGPAHDGLDDEPPASVMLEIDAGLKNIPRPAAASSSRRAGSARGPKMSIFEQSRIPDQEPPYPEQQRSKHRASWQDEAGAQDGIERLSSDEEAVLLARHERARGYPESSSRASSRGSKRKPKSRSRRSKFDSNDQERLEGDEESGLGHRTASSSNRSDRSSHRHRRQGHGQRCGWDWASAWPSTSPRSRRMALGGLDPRQKALWMWANVDNMDAFLQEVYAYYVGKGAICIALSRALNLLTIAFVIGFSTFLLGCVDYSSIRHDGQLSQVIVGHCVSRFSNLSLLLFVSFAVFYGWQVVQFGFGLSRLAAMHRFYTHLLNIPDADVQSIPWNEVVNRIATLREEHPITSLSSQAESGDADQTKEKLDAHDVANRIMRQENYLIALFNKDTLDLSIPGLRHRSPALTRSLEWNLNFCLLGFLFDSRGQVRRQFLTDRHRGQLIDGLRRRFMFMAIINAVFAPFIVLYLLTYSFFRYFEEYHKDPSNLGSRQYTQYARWKFREFNELPHLFRRRCHSSYPYAQRYIDQFPKEKTAVIARFVAFIAGSFTAVLLLASVIDPDLFLHFDITPQRNVLFYIGVFGTVLAVSRGMIPDEHLVFEPEILLRAVIHHTHHMPEGWRGRFHSADVHVEFGQLYTLKVYIFFQELFSVVTTPFALWLSLPKSAPAIIDFFREFTVHVDGIGYVCSFAVFNFRRDGTAHPPGGTLDQQHGVGEGARRREPHASGHGGGGESRQAKMEQSMLGFKANHPDWEPTDPMSSLFLSRMAAIGGAGAGAGAGADDTLPALGRSLDGGGGSGVATLDSGRLQPGDLSGSHGKHFSPIDSTLLTTRSQFYDDAFSRSIALARSDNKKRDLDGSRRSRSKGRPRAIKQDSFTTGIAEEDENEDVGDDGNSYVAAAAGGARRADSRISSNSNGGDLDGEGSTSTSRVGDAQGGAMEQSHFDASAAGGKAGVRDLLHHIYAGRGAPGGPRW